MSDRKISIVFSVISLLALIAGGIFVSQHWRTTVYAPSQSVENEEEKALTESPASEESTTTQEFSARARELIEKSEELITQIQEKIALIETAKEKSSQVKGVYMNEFITNSQTPIAFNTRQSIKNLLDETELNGVVIDVKEAYGPNLPSSLRKLIDEFHQKDVWVIARICAFRDSSLKETKPELYLKDVTATTSDNFWQDAGGGYWLDPQSPEVQQYLIDFAKQAIDFGFDELQFDYVRFPSDGNLKNIVYPSYDKTKEKYEVIRDFFGKVSSDLRDYKPSIILSVDLFGYVATQYQALTIGQRLIDAVEPFDYISFMLYPSHFYGGFSVPEDSKRQLPAVYFPFRDDTTTSTLDLVSNNPYQVILRSIFSALDYITSYGVQTKIRPWLQDFNLKFDMERGIFYDAEKVKAQIQAAEDSGSSDWLLWNSSNVYTEETFSNP